MGGEGGGSERGREGSGFNERRGRDGLGLGSEREEGERERVYAVGWRTKLVEPSSARARARTLALTVAVIVFALQLGSGEACFRV